MWPIRIFPRGVYRNPVSMFFLYVFADDDQFLLKGDISSCCLSTTEQV
jgi:hypothetical protein